MKQELEEILLKPEVLSVQYLEENKKRLFEIIPELKAEEGFDQKSAWHIYDVWEHTEVALSNSKQDRDERVALLLHDIGKPHCYQEDGEVRHFKGHAGKSAEMAEVILRRLGYEEKQIEFFCWMIGNHSTTIDTNQVNENNIKRMNKLLDIQYCDTNAYNPEKIEPVIARLDSIKEEMQRKEKAFNEEEIR